MSNLSSKAKRIKSLKNGKGIEYLLNEAYEIFGNPILIHDMEYKIIDINKNVITDDPIWNEYSAKGTVSYEWLEFFKNECFLEAAANTKKITFLLTDKLKYERIFGKLFNKNNIQIGCAVLIACNQNFEDEDPELFEEFCDILSAEFGKIEFYTEYGQAYFEKLVAQLIAGVDDIALYTAHVESIYIHLKSNIYLAVVDISKADTASNELANYRDLFKKKQPEYLYAIYENYILILVGTDEQVMYVEKDLNQLNKLFEKRNIYAGVSRSFENLFELNKYHQEALATLNKAHVGTKQRIFLYEQIK